MFQKLLQENPALQKAFQKATQCVGGAQYFTPVATEQIATIIRDTIPMNERMGFKLLPFKSFNATVIRTRRPDYIRGLQPFRDSYTASPKLDDYFNRFGVYCLLETDEWAEHEDIHAYEIAESVSPDGCNTDAVDVTELMSIRMAQLVTRQMNRQEVNIWNAVIFGSYVAEKGGQVIQTHKYPIRYLPPSIGWSDYTNSTPIKDLRAIRLLFRGLKLRFDKKAMFIVNQATLECLLSNLNPKDLGKTVVSACCESLTQGVMAERFNAFDLPAPMVYDEGYWTRDQFHLFIPDGYAVLVARHTDGVPLGYYCLTRHAQSCTGNKTGVGQWTKIDDNCDRSAGELRRIRIELGHSGVVRIDYPEAIIVIPTQCTGSI